MSAKNNKAMPTKRDNLAKDKIEANNKAALSQKHQDVRKPELMDKSSTLKNPLRKDDDMTKF